MVVLPALLLSLVMYALGVYEPAAQRDTATLVHRLIMTCAIGAVLALAAHNLPVGRTMPLGQSVLTVAGACLAVFANRMVLRRSAALDALKCRILVLGAGHRANGLLELLRRDGTKRMMVHGFMDLGGQMRLSNAAVPADLVVGETGRLSDYAGRHGITEIVVALDDRRGVLPGRELLDCKLRGIRVTDASAFYEREAGQVDLDNLYPSWLIFSDGFRRGWTAGALKRLFDVAVSAAFLVLMLPLMACTAIAIRLDSGGPVFYRQIRVGLDGRHFRVLKFRSMTVDAEPDGRPRWAGANDSRITRVGAFIRKTRIDETPQMLNVLRGEMSLVGPRPERPAFVDYLSRHIPFYDDRHRVKPGLTGWAQINFPYGASIDDAREKLKYDLYYMKNYSFFFDILIVLRTAQVVFWPTGAR
jgi:sugar transferase (PEP-CTERM system associated)